MTRVLIDANITIQAWLFFHIKTKFVLVAEAVHSKKDREPSQTVDHTHTHTKANSCNGEYILIRNILKLIGYLEITHTLKIKVIW